MSRRLQLVVVVCCAALVGCGSSATAPSSSAGSSAPSLPSNSSILANPNFKPPQQHNQGGRPDVTYDPCLRIDDATVRAMGFDPASRARDDFVSEYTFLECKFKSALRYLTIKSGNITMEQERERYTGMFENLDINGREAIIVREPNANDTCALNMRTNQGYVRIATVLTVDALVQKIGRCDGIADIAKAVEPTIGEGK
ncbi:DUF3558 family protein [Antrihabitans cavernicola]|uniref:DUF3558 domain-containing protein n=1 Tax=Antrihabitans cavernicola TaxID=2495913 RepID=A0A5A7SJP8_9NOCA|nr:DUF3558 family protein [Spelaeibacter cavernicola]KAA0024987.1 DUF3558 domain-containing protein [Spelaeibacter cavernicola]